MPIYKTGEKKNGREKYRVVVSYVAPDGRYRKKERTVYGSAEAKATESQLMSELKQATPAAVMTVKELFNEYIAAKKNEVRETTLDKTRRTLLAEVIPQLGDTSLSKLNKKVLQNWKNDISNRDLALTTKRNFYKEFCAMLNFAVKLDYIPKNYLTDLGNFKDTTFEPPAEKIQYYTAEQFKQFISVAKSNARSLSDWGMYVFFNIAFYTGARKGEINALKWSDIEGDTMHIRRSIAQKLKGGDRETAPKNKTSIRDIKLPQPLIAILDEHKLRQQEDRNFSEDYRVCGGISCLRDSNISNHNKAFADAANLPHIRVHDFRHTHATLLINEGINIQEIARRLGHANVKMTWDVYAHLYPREEERALTVLDKIDFSKL